MELKIWKNLLEDRNMFVLIVIPNFLILIRKKLFVQTVKQKKIQKKLPVSPEDFKTEKEVETVDDNLELSEEVEF